MWGFEGGKGDKGACFFVWGGGAKGWSICEIGGGVSHDCQGVPLPRFNFSHWSVLPAGSCLKAIACYT